jgi:hypothetical protein
MTKTSSTPISGVLLLVVGILAGFIGGYAIARQGAPVSADIQTLGQPQTGDCPHNLEPGDRPILAGFICPAPECTDPVVDCHCELAHRIKDQVKVLLREGKSHEEIRAEIREQYKLGS